MNNYLNQKDDERTIRFYELLLKKHGKNFNSLNWGSKESQFKRFEILASIGIKSNDKVLDVGCGLADFYDWLQINIPFVDYHGIDLTGEMVRQTKERFPELSIENKIIFDISSEKAVYDFVVASGIFYLRQENPLEYMLKTIEKMFELAKKGIAFNSLSTWSAKHDKNEFYADPLELLSLIKSNLTTKVILRHDYHPNDFSIFIYK